MNTNHTPFSGIYIHIPFCVRKCPYCDFYSVSDTALEAAFLEALQMEMRMRSSPSLTFDTLYIGGGTPSVLKPSSIDCLIQTACRCFSILPDAEITIEVNPGTVDAEKLRDYRRAGINRINIGVQSFQDENLRFLGRVHSAADATNVLRWARQAGFDNVGLDLIYGIPGQSRQCWRQDLATAVDIQPEHLSCYMLTFEAGTLMDKRRQKGEIEPLQEGKLSELFETTIGYLAYQDYRQYEISNFARQPARRSRHNQKYWAFVPYIGLGPSAHSFTAPERSWNHRSVKRYIAAISSGLSPIEDKEVLTRGQQMIEMIYLGLRKTEGIDLQRFNQQFGVDFNHQCKHLIEQLQKEKYLETTQNHCFLTRRGQILLDSIADMLIAAVR